jgi:BirA family biotin operon repressor/biotin-[acetyl-CoA-carboxylase] ligase
MSLILVYDELDSTNSEAWRLVDRQQGRHKMGIWARTQTHGRGQRGHTWDSPVGGLYLSVLLALNLPVERAGEITLWSAWSIATHLNNYVQGAPIRLKWQNDLFLQGRKLVLTETKVQGEQIRWAVVGIGINYLNPVPAGGINLHSVNHAIPSLDCLVQIVHRSIVAGYDQWLSWGEGELERHYQLLRLPAF